MDSAFRYADILLCQRPQHKNDRFSYRHPPMPREKRAKIFAPFAALSGYGESIAESRKVFVPRRELCEDEQAELNEKLTALHERCQNSRMIRENTPRVRVEYFVPLRKKESGAEAETGQYRVLTGTICVFDPYKKTMKVDNTVVRFADIAELYL